MNIKVCLIDPVGGKGGMEFYDYGLAIGLSKNDVEVYYFTCNQTKEIKINNVQTIFSFGDIWKKNKISKLLLLFKGYIKAFLFSKKKNIKHVHFQFFHLGFQNILVLVFAKFFGLKRIVTLHDIDSFRNKDSKFFQKFAFFLINHFIVHNQFSYEELKEKRIKKSKISIIPHGNYFPFVDKIEYQPKDQNMLKLLFFGQIKEVKGLDILIKAFAKASKSNKNLHLTIAGNPWGTSKDFYENLIRELEIESIVNTIFAYIPNKDVNNYFEACDIVVLPYKKIYQSGILLLSMSYGRVTLASDLEAFKEIIEHGENGFIFKSEDIDSLSKQISSLAENKKTLKVVRDKALITLKSKFDWVDIGLETKRIYEKD